MSLQYFEQYDVNHRCHINSNPPKKIRNAKYLAGWLAQSQLKPTKKIGKKNEKMKCTLRAGWHNHCCQESCHPPLPPTHPARKSDEKNGFDRDEKKLFLKKFCEKFYLTQREFSSCKNLRLFCPWQIDHVTLCFFLKKAWSKKLS